MDNDNKFVRREQVYTEEDILEINSTAKPCWILTNPRSGSTWLCRMLNATGLFGDQRPNGNPEFKPLDGSFPNTWTEHCNPFWFNQKTYNGVYKYVHKFKPAVNKLQKFQFDVIFTQNGKIPIFSAKEKITSWYPEMKYIYLKRKDVIAQSLSYYMAKYDEFIDWQILKCYNEAQQYETNWLPFLGKSNYLEIYYEDLVKDPISKIKEVLDFIGIPYKEDQVRSEVGITKEVKPNYAKYRNRLEGLIDASRKLSEEFA